MISRICPTSLSPSLILIQNDGSQFIAGVRHLLTTGNIGTYSCIYMGGTTFTTMKPKKKQKKLRITEKDFLLANRRAARMEEIEAHGRPVSYRKAIHKSKKVYDRKALKRQASSDDLPLSYPYCLRSLLPLGSRMTMASRNASRPPWNSDKS